jgi:DNA polymerase IV
MALYNRSLTNIGAEIKRRFRKEIGEWMVCSIGISTNRFLAKLTASLKKHDGLETIDHTNVLAVYERVSLLDLNGINTRNQARLNAYGIFTPMEFFQAPFLSYGADVGISFTDSCTKKLKARVSQIC